jgi:RNA polymerase sigma factor for flagellar operon FliA
MSPEPHVERLFRENKALLETVARRMARRFGGAVELDDLRSLGGPALLQAAQTFDPSRAKFTTYASHKIRWAMLDGVRRETHGRSAAARALALLASERYAEGTADRDDPSEPPQPEESYQGRLRELLDGHATALAAGLSAAHAKAELTPDPIETPEDRVLRADLLASVRRAVAELPDRERQLVERHYFGDEPFDAIAADLGISKSWASRLHAQAIDRLGVAMRRAA